MMKILFLGGTGRLSKDVVRAARKQGCDVYLVTRGSEYRKRYIEEEYNMITCNIRDTLLCKKILEGYEFDVVVDFLSFVEDDVKSTLEIIDGKFKQYIFISSATVYDPEKDELISEEKTKVGNGKWQYAYSKYLCEQYIIKYFSDKSTLAYTIIRPYVTYGDVRVPYLLVPRNTLHEWSLIQRILQNDPIPVLDIEPIKTTLTHNLDFAVGLVGVFMNEKAFRESIHITSDVTTKWEDVLDIIGKIVGKEIHKIRVTKDDIYQYMPEYREVLEGDKTRQMRFDNSKIKSIVPEYDCQISLEAGIREMIENYQKNEELQIIDQKWNWCVNQICKKKTEVNTVENLNKNKIIIFGAGDYGQQLFRFLATLNIDVFSFCQTVLDDKKELYGIPIISMESLKEIEDVNIIFIAIKDERIVREIKGHLRSIVPNNVKILETADFIIRNKDVFF